MSQGFEVFKNLSYRRYDVQISATGDVVFDAWPGAIMRNNLLYATEQVRVQKSARSLREQIEFFPLEKDHPLYNELKEGFPKGYVLTNFSFADTSDLRKEGDQLRTDVREPDIYMKIQKGDLFCFSLLLIGHFNDYRFYFFEAIRQMCERGIGKPLTPFTLIDITENPSSPIALNGFTVSVSSPIQPEVDDIPTEITLRFLTPVILYRLRDKKNTQVSYQDKSNRFPSFYQLIRSCFSRAQKLYALYENPSEKTASFFDESFMEAYLEKAGRPLLKSADIQHVILPNTQKKGIKNELPLAGYTGEQSYFGELQQYLPLLKFLQELGVGNETVYGMGRFEIEKQHVTSRIDKNQKIEVENEAKILDSFLVEETDEHLPKMTKLSQLIIRFKNQINQIGIPQFADKYGELIEVTQSGNPYYYPMIQYKRINGQAVIFCIGEGTEHIGSFFASAGSNKEAMEIETVKAEKTIVQAWDSDFVFSIRKYLPFSNELYTEYQKINEVNARNHLLLRILKANILFFIKSIGIHADREIVCEITGLEEKAKVKYKNHTFASFDLRFRTNISLPNYIGLGIGVSHGFGTVARVRSQKNS